MDLVKQLSKISSALLLGITLTSCTSYYHFHHAVPDAYPTPNNTSIMASAAATKGAMVGSTIHPSAVPVGAAIGGVAGGTVGVFAGHPNAILNRLAKQGVQVIAMGQNVKLIIFTDKCFEFGTSDLTNQCDAILNSTAALLKLTGNTPIKVAGYSDNNFGEAFALRLTQEQADSVVAYLWAHGIPQQRFTAKGYGSADPIATNYTTRGNGLNRRVEISLG